MRLLSKDRDMFTRFQKKTENNSKQEVNSIEELARLAGLRSENYFTAHRLSCSEANLLVLNHAFGGGLSSQAAIDLACGFGGGVGDSGCTCGALSGIVIGLGLYLGPGCKAGLNKKKFRALIGKIHDDFKSSAGSVLCRDLIADFRKERKKRNDNCSALTGKCAELAVMILLEHRPELAKKADLEFLQGNDSRLQVMIGKIMSGWRD